MKAMNKFFVTIPILFMVVVLNSCRTDSILDPVINPDATLVLRNIGARSVEIYLENNSNGTGHTLLVTKKSDGSAVLLGTQSGFGKLENLEPGETYIAIVRVTGYEEAQYNRVEFTTKPFDYLLDTNLEESPGVKTELGFLVELKTNGGEGTDLGGLQLFLVDRDSSDFKLKLDVAKTGATLKFIVPEESMPTPRSYFTRFTLQYGTNANALEPLQLEYGDSKTELNVTVYRPEAYIGHWFSSDAVIGDRCILNTFQANFEGFFYWNFVEGYDEKKMGIIIKNLDTDKELILTGATFDSEQCNRFGIDNISFADNTTQWNDLVVGKLYVSFLEDESLGFVAGNYSVKITYELADGFHESNTFEFVIEE